MIKKGLGLTGWIETIIIIILFISVFSVSIVDEMNNYYDSNKSVGLNTQSYTDQLEDLSTKYQNKIGGGEVTFTVLGFFSLLTSWDLIKQTLQLLWGFVNGTFIVNILNMIGVPHIVSTAFQLIFVIALGGIILAIVLRLVQPKI
jgi:hypothetical protein